MESTLESCYQKVLMFFRKSKPEFARDMAQETVARTLQNLRDGKELTTDLCWYMMGIARNVLLEEWRKPVGAELDLNRHGIEEKSVGLEHLEDAIYRDELAQEIFRDITKADRQLFSDYHLGFPEELSEKMGITPNALRIRVHRIKKRILDNVEDCRRRGIM